MPVPIEIKLCRPSCCLEITFEDGVGCCLPFGYLRTHSPAVGELPQELAEVTITAVEPVGALCCQAGLQ